MNKVFLFLTITITSPFLVFGSSNNIHSIDKYEIEVPKVFSDEIGGLTPAIGSGIEFVKKDIDNKLYFVGITDRGFNYYPINSNERIFPFPDFNPFISVIELNPKVGASVVGDISIKIDGRKASGLPIKLNKFHQDEKPFSEKLASIAIENHGHGIDTEALTLDQDDNIWISDEYGPSLIKLDQYGNKLKILTPGKGLPEIIKYRQINRGIEALTNNKKGKLYFSLESTLDVDKQTKSSANFIRFYELDFNNNVTKSFAYKIDDKYISNGEVKIGDIDYIDDNNFILIEQGPDKSAKMQNFIYLVNISDATNIHDLKINDKELEFANNDELRDISFIKKKLLLNVRDYGWDHEKLEGVTIIDNKTIALTNDTDFGADMYVKDMSKKDLKLCKFGVSGGLLCKDKFFEPNLFINNYNLETSLWVVNFDKEII